MDIVKEKNASDASWLERHASDVRSYHQLTIDRLISNWRFYWALNPELGLGQWPANVASRMIQDGRGLLQYNITKPTIDAIAGGILQQKFEPNFLPAFGDATTLTTAIKQVMVRDRELCDWHAAYLELVIHGLICYGVIRLIIIRDYNQMGNIGIETLLPGSVLFDPDHKETLIKNCKFADRDAWLTVGEIADIYPEHAEKVKWEADRLKKDGPSYDTGGNILPNLAQASRAGSKYRVVERTEQVKQRITKEFAVRITGESIEIPSGMEDNLKPEWLNSNVPDWDPGMVYEKPEVVSITMVRSACSMLTNELLENTPHQIQLGRLPFFRWAASCNNGEVQGMVDALRDLQANINYGESMIQHKLQVEGSGGSQFIDKSIFESEAEAMRYARDRNNPRAVFKLKPGFLDRGAVPAVPTHKSQFPADIYQHVNHLFETLLPRISKVSPSYIGRPEQGNQTSGRLYELLKIQSDTSLYTIHYGLHQFWNEFYESYLMLAVDVYGIADEDGVPYQREFKGGDLPVTLNEQVELEDGRIAIKNDIRELRRIRHRIVISETQESPTTRYSNIATLSQYMSMIPPEATASRILINAEIAKNIDQFSKATKEQLEKTSQMEYEKAMSMLELDLLKIETEKQMAEQQLKQLEVRQAAEQIGNQSIPAPLAPGMPQEIPQEMLQATPKINTNTPNSVQTEQGEM